MGQHQELILFFACVALGFAAMSNVDATASDCHRLYSPDPPYPLVVDEVEGDDISGLVPSAAEAWLPPLVGNSSSWRIEGNDPTFLLVLEAAE